MLSSICVYPMPRLLQERTLETVFCPATVNQIWVWRMASCSQFGLWEAWSQVQGACLETNYRSLRQMVIICCLHINNVGSLLWHEFVIPRLVETGISEASHQSEFCSKHWGLVVWRSWVKTLPHRNLAARYCWLFFFFLSGSNAELPGFGDLDSNFKNIRKDDKIGHLIWQISLN